MARTMINGMMRDESWQAMTMLAWAEGRTYEIEPGTTVEILQMTFFLHSKRASGYT